MMTYSKSTKSSAEKTVRDIRRATRRNYSAEEKIRIVLEGLRGEESIATLCRKEGINQNLYYRWSKEFLEAGKKRLATLSLDAAHGGHTGWESPSHAVAVRRLVKSVFGRDRADFYRLEKYVVAAITRH